MLNNAGENIDEFVIDNLKLYYYLINRRCKYNEDIDNIKDYGLMMYIGACKTFDPSKGYKFSAYLSRTVTSIINSYYSRSSDYLFYKHNVSLNSDISSQKDSSITYEEILTYKVDKFSNSENKSLIKEALAYVDRNCSDRDKQIFLDHLSGIKQRDIAKTFNITQTQVSRIVKKIQKTLQNKFKNEPS